MTISIKFKYLFLILKAFLKSSGDIRNSLILSIFPKLDEILFLFVFIFPKLVEIAPVFVLICPELDQMFPLFVLICP